MENIENAVSMPNGYSDKLDLDMAPRVTSDLRVQNVEQQLRFS